ncbi:unnamed protein product [Ceratitis capitata]|uniref:(Mediterranean fruit fly) hypothetical protein n=1 Tax=Ceratitis capitata TaxID=7213 RepID=A0A811U3F3_CERCA|nr:unnamed protein product [Ceratitis capitata]
MSLLLREFWLLMDFEGELHRKKLVVVLGDHSSLHTLNLLGGANFANKIQLELRSTDLDVED